MDKQAYINSLKEEIYKVAAGIIDDLEEAFRRSSIDESIKNISIEESIKNISIEEALKGTEPPWLKGQGKSKLPLILAGTGAAVAGSAGYLNYLKNKRQQEYLQRKQASVNSLKEQIYKQAGIFSAFKSNVSKINDLTKANKDLTMTIKEMQEAATRSADQMRELRKGNKAWKRVSAVGTGVGAAGVGYGLNERRKAKNQIANYNALY